MPKGTLEYDLEEPFEYKEFQMAVTGRHAYMALQEISETLRRILKNDHDGKLSEFQNQFHDIIESHGVDMDLLYWKGINGYI